MENNLSAEEFVRVYDAPDQSSAELVCATLQAEGIRAIVQNQYGGPAAGILPHLGTSYSRGVLVPAAEADTARILLSASQMSEEELAEQVDADTMTLEEAEARVK